MFPKVTFLKIFLNLSYLGLKTLFLVHFNIMFIFSFVEFLISMYQHSIVKYFIFILALLKPKVTCFISSLYEWELVFWKEGNFCSKIRLVTHYNHWFKTSISYQEDFFLQIIIFVHKSIKTVLVFLKTPWFSHPNF